MAAPMKMCSDWCGRVDDLQAWSSPATASAPPHRDVPTALAWRKASTLRSTPGPLPYHMPNTPSNFGSACSSICWLPDTEVAASSSLTAGLKRTLWRSSPANGEPRYPETNPAVLRPC